MGSADDARPSAAPTEATSGELEPQASEATPERVPPKSAKTGEKRRGRRNRNAALDQSAPPVQKPKKAKPKPNIQDPPPEPSVGLDHLKDPFSEN
jgi:hypothetical protein